MIVNFVFLSKIKKAYISKPFLITIFLYALIFAHFRNISRHPTLFAMVTNLRITQYPLFLTHNISKKLVFQLLTHRPIQVTHNLTLASHSSSTPFSAISSLFLSTKAKGRKTQRELYKL